MSEIERVIELVESFQQGDVALLEMKFLFSQEGLCRAFSQALPAADVMPIRVDTRGYIAGVREVVKLDEEVMRSLCHSYREIAYNYEGVPLPWAVKIKS